ncbi:hypothetical protein EX895_000989 [Sporisorium graminicola]|uniref:Uncharacterized protein n=1 Tax=Sporisorium graminicola TaxID=280036 RepID=A0A4U7L2G5_9BASI|nr:hypothetical protein EX895_000989 [Sporisorium graminicola]TKY90990.1 hypothetical protein EX895_000989 [Sporisorium graminicola]
MRRSASPSKAVRSATPVRPTVSGDSSSVLRTPFKPLSGLEGRRQASVPSPQGHGASGGTAASSADPTAAAIARRELRARTLADLQQEVADMELILNQRLKTHNAARAKAKLPAQEAEHIVAEYISLLTEYNKVKDSAQVVFDKIADIQQLPAKDIHARYGVGETNSHG